MMNTNNAWTTALLRAAYAAVITGLIAGLTASQTGASDRDAIVTGLLAALTVLATRGGLEGVYDQHRNAVGNTSSSDVGQP